MIALLSTADTDLLAAKASGADFSLANPAYTPTQSLSRIAREADVIVYRQLGSRHAIADQLEMLKESGTPLVVVSGEQAPDADLMSASSVPGGVARTVHDYLANGGSANMRNMWAFLSDTVLLTGHGFDPPVTLPAWGHLLRQWSTTPNADAEMSSAHGSQTRPRVAVVFYRAQQLAGNTAYIHALCDALEEAGSTPVPLYCTSLRQPEPELLQVLGGCDAAIVTVLAAGGATPATAQAGGDDDAWNVAHLVALDIPVLQGLCLTWGRSAWEKSDDGMRPLDVATQVAVPEFDGRVITVPFSFKELGDDGLISYVPDAERCSRLARIATRHAKLRHIAPAQKRVALVFSAYPTKHARIGNAVGLDSAASVVALLGALREAGYDLGSGEVPGLDSGSSDDMMHALIDAGGQDENWLSAEQLAANPHRVPADTWRRWFDDVDPELRSSVEGSWGPAPGQLFVDHGPNSIDPDGDICIAALQYGNILVMVQPPRGFGENPIAIYHDPEMAPSHHYLAAYRWLAEPVSEGGFEANAVVHIGKHGNMEWLPGKNLALSAACGPDAAIGDLPLIYPFLVNDPGEGAQAKRRAHAVLIDHLVPPIARAESYGDIARLEQLLDEHANIAALDPAKLPAIRQQIWTLIQAAKMDRDLGWESRPDEDVFDDMIMHIDGWLCEIKDVQIRDGLHILSAAPAGEHLVDLVTAMLRARQLWGGERTVPGLREALGLAEDGSEKRGDVDATEVLARALVTGLAEHSWDPAAASEVLAKQYLPAGADHECVSAILDFACREVVPRILRTSEEIPQVLRALEGRYIQAGPSGSPLRGLINVLPTGRNFYSVDPRALPSQLAWETGRLMADSLLARHLEDKGHYPKSVGLSVWGTSAMRTSGDDIAEIFALLGVQPQWDEASRRILGVEPIPLDELGRPRIDVTVRISGFFRDAFPHVIALIDDAVDMVSALPESPEDNYIRAHVDSDIEQGHDKRRATTRIFGSKPGTYGAGMLQLMESRNWRDDADLAEVYTTWGGYAYGRGLDGMPAGDDMRRAYRRIQVAAKNVDSVEHDILDSDDYYQYHGGMIAAVRALTGENPESYIGDSTRPDTVKTRSLQQETSRIFRARVVNPKWLAAMRRHGYKGAFEMAATVDYLFGYDATTGVVDDWMYESVTKEYVLDPVNREFMEQSNPWALHGIAERLLEAVERGMWAEPSDAILGQLRDAYLESEGQLEDR